MLKKLTLAVLGLTLAMGGNALAGTHVGKVDQVMFHVAGASNGYDVNGKGMAFIYMDPPLPPACGFNNPRVAITHDHPLFAAIVSSALMAKANGMQVQLNWVDECTIFGSAWDFWLMTILPDSNQ